MIATQQLFVAVLLLSLVTLTGCAGQKESMLKQGYPITYVDGFDDGCHSGNRAGGVFLINLKKM